MNFAELVILWRNHRAEQARVWREIFDPAGIKERQAHGRHRAHLPHRAFNAPRITKSAPWPRWEET